MMEGIYPVPLRVRSRLLRAWRWPIILWRFRRAGLSWRRAWALTHWVIWFTPKGSHAWLD